MAGEIIGESTVEFKMKHSCAIAHKESRKCLFFRQQTPFSGESYRRRGRLLSPAGGDSQMWLSGGLLSTGLLGFLIVFR